MWDLGSHFLRTTAATFMLNWGVVQRVQLLQADNTGCRSLCTILKWGTTYHITTGSFVFTEYFAVQCFSRCVACDVCKYVTLIQLAVSGCWRLCFHCIFHFEATLSWPWHADDPRRRQSAGWCCNRTCKQGQEPCTTCTRSAATRAVSPRTEVADSHHHEGTKNWSEPALGLQLIPCGRWRLIQC